LVRETRCSYILDSAAGCVSLYNLLAPPRNFECGRSYRSSVLWVWYKVHIVLTLCGSKQATWRPCALMELRYLLLRLSGRPWHVPAARFLAAGLPVSQTTAHCFSRELSLIGRPRYRPQSRKIGDRASLRRPSSPRPTLILLFTRC
jgi:hypothetical protein